MAKSPHLSMKRSAANDFAVTFHFTDGQSATVFIPQAHLSKSNSKDVARALGDAAICALCCNNKAGSAACMYRCVEIDGKCCDGGYENCQDTGT